MAGTLNVTHAKRHLGEIAALLGSAALSACAPVPQDRDVKLIDRELPQNACVGALSRWERHYFFPMVQGAPALAWWRDRSQVGFSFKQAGVFGFRAGELREDVRNTAHDYDHRRYRHVLGRYNLLSQRLGIVSCGWTCSPGEVCG